MAKWFYADFVLCPIFESAAQVGPDRALLRLRNKLRIHGDTVNGDTMRSAVGSYLTALVAGVTRDAALAAAFWELEDCPGRSPEWERLARHYDECGCAFPWAPENAHVDIITRKTWPPLLMLRMQRS